MLYFGDPGKIPCEFTSDFVFPYNYRIINDHIRQLLLPAVWQILELANASDWSYVIISESTLAGFGTRICVPSERILWRIKDRGNKHSFSKYGVAVRRGFVTLNSFLDNFSNHENIIYILLRNHHTKTKSKCIINWSRNNILYYC
jgi:hypothetical protein